MIENEKEKVETPTSGDASPEAWGGEIVGEKDYYDETLLDRPGYFIVGIDDEVILCGVVRDPDTMEKVKEELRRYNGSYSLSPLLERLTRERIASELHFALDPEILWDEVLTGKRGVPYAAEQNSLLWQRLTGEEPD